MLGIVCGSERVSSGSSRLHLLPPRLILWRVPPQVSPVLQSKLFIWSVLVLKTVALQRRYIIHLILFILFSQHNWNKMHPEPRRSRVWYRHKCTQSYLRSDASMVRYNRHCWVSVKQFLYILIALEYITLKFYFLIAGLGSTSPHCFPSSKSLSCLSSFTWKGCVTWCHHPISMLCVCVCLFENFDPVFSALIRRSVWVWTVSHRSTPPGPLRCRRFM